MMRLQRAARLALLPEDTRSRHVVAARLLEAPGRVLDVGGVRGVLALFLPESSVTTANVERPTDVLLDGARLPFCDASFDAVTSLDVLEHVSPDARSSHVAELARVAATAVVLSCPLGTEEHVRAEQDLARWYRGVTGRSHRFLDEHLANGLPNERELLHLADETGMAAELLYAGDFRLSNEVFQLGVRARHERRPDLVVRYLRARRARSREAELGRTPSRWTNRAFLVMKRAFGGTTDVKVKPCVAPGTPAPAGTLRRT
jgi:hypothetical protein